MHQLAIIYFKASYHKHNFKSSNQVEKNEVKRKYKKTMDRIL